MKFLLNALHGDFLAQVWRGTGHNCQQDREVENSNCRPRRRSICDVRLVPAQIRPTHYRRPQQLLDLRQALHGGKPERLDGGK